MWNGRTSEEAPDTIWANDAVSPYESPSHSNGPGGRAPPREFYLPPPRPLVIPGLIAQPPPRKFHLPPVRPLSIPSAEVWRPPPSQYHAPAPLVYPFATRPDLDRVIDISSSSDDSSYGVVGDDDVASSKSHSQRGDPWAGAAPARAEAYEQGNVYDGHRGHFGSPNARSSTLDTRDPSRLESVCDTSRADQFRSQCGDKYQDGTDPYLRLSHNHRHVARGGPPSSAGRRPHPYRLQYEVASDEESGPSGHWAGGRSSPSPAIRHLQDNPDWEGSRRDNSRTGSTSLSHGPAVSNSGSSYESSEDTKSVSYPLCYGGGMSNSRSRYESSGEGGTNSTLAHKSSKGSNGPTTHSLSDSKGSQESESDNTWSIPRDKASHSYSHSNLQVSEASVTAKHSNHSAMSNPHGYEESGNNPWSRARDRNTE